MAYKTSLLKQNFEKTAAEAKGKYIKASRLISGPGPPPDPGACQRQGTQHTTEHQNTPYNTRQNMPHDV